MPSIPRAPFLLHRLLPLSDPFLLLVALPLLCTFLVPLLVLLSAHSCASWPFIFLPPSSPPSQAQELKERGNRALAAGDVGGAVRHYTAAIALDGRNHVLFSNRSAAYARQGDYARALADACRTLELRPDWAKVRGGKPLGVPRLGQQRGLTRVSPPPRATRARRRRWSSCIASRRPRRLTRRG